MDSLSTYATSPLQHRSEADHPRLRELEFSNKTSIRGDSGNADFCRVFDEMDLSLPTDPNTYAESDEKLLFWMGPDEWLLRSKTSSNRDHEGLVDALGHLHAAVVDVSDYYTVIRLAGENAHEVLARSCPLDLSPLVFTQTDCAQTRIGNAACLLHPTPVNDKPGIDIQVRWSFADYLWTLLDRSGRFVPG